MLKLVYVFEAVELRKAMSTGAGDPPIDFLIAKSLANYGLWNDSIKILQDLDKRGILGKEGKGLLALTYFNRVDKSKGFVRYTGNFYGLNDWRLDIEKAIALDPSQNLIREMWVSLLGSYIRKDLRGSAINIRINIPAL